MPEIAIFLGIVILMYWKDHNPPHFHARYADYEISVAMDGVILDGKFPARAKRLVLEWLDLHRKELLDNWLRASRGEALQMIESLE